MLQALSGMSPLFWGLDALKQLIENRPMCSPEEVALLDRLSGVLGPCNLKLGIVLASLSPFVLYAAGRRFGSVGWVVRSEERRVGNGWVGQGKFWGSQDHKK